MKDIHRRKTEFTGPVSNEMNTQTPRTLEFSTLLASKTTSRPDSGGPGHRTSHLTSKKSMSQQWAIKSFHHSQLPRPHRITKTARAKLVYSGTNKMSLFSRLLIKGAVLNLPDDCGGAGGPNLAELLTTRDMYYSK